MCRFVRDIVWRRRNFLIITLLAQIKIEARVTFVTSTNDGSNTAIVAK